MIEEERALLFTFSAKASLAIPFGNTLRAILGGQESVLPTKFNYRLVFVSRLDGSNEFL